MQQHLKTELISEQIDVVIMGPCAYKLIQLLIQQQKTLNNTQSQPNNKYISLLNKILQKDFPIAADPCLHHDKTKIKKFTTNMLTDSFWIQFNFFYLGEMAYDPFVAEFTKGRTSICIIANDDSQTNSAELKKMIINENGRTLPISRPIAGQSSVSNKNSSARDELFMEQHIINILHQLRINNFQSVLGLKILENERIVEEATSFRLSRNQIFKWIVERYFQNEFSIKLAVELGDQIENFQPKEETKLCSLM